MLLCTCGVPYVLSGRSVGPKAHVRGEGWASGRRGGRGGGHINLQF